MSEYPTPLVPTSYPLPDPSQWQLLQDELRALSEKHDALSGTRLISYGIANAARAGTYEAAALLVDKYRTDKKGHR